MAFAAAVMSTSAGHKAFIRSPSHDEILDSYSQHHQHHHQHPATPPRNEPIGTTTTPPSQSSLSSSSSSRRLAVLPRSTSNNSNLNATMNSPDSNYISQFNTSLSSFKPRSPPGMHSNNAMPESPHMIRCSTCNSLVPLLELSDHVCRPSVTSSSSTTTSTSAIPLHNPRQPSQPSQHARLASGFNHNAPSPPSMSNYPAPAQPALREMLNPLRVNVSQAEQRNGQPLEARKSVSDTASAYGFLTDFHLCCSRISSPSPSYSVSNTSSKIPIRSYTYTLSRSFTNRNFTSTLKSFISICSS